MKSLEFKSSQERCDGVYDTHHEKLLPSRPCGGTVNTVFFRKKNGKGEAENCGLVSVYRGVWLIGRRIDTKIPGKS